MRLAHPLAGKWRGPGALRVLLLGFFVIWGFPAQRGEAPRPAPQHLPSRQEMWRGLSQQRRMKIVYAGANATARQRYQEYFDTLPSRRFRVSACADRDFSLDSLGHAPLRIVGVFAGNRVLQALLPQLPLKKTKQGFEFSSQAYQDSSDVLQLFFPNPRNPAMPLWVTTGNSDAAILDYLKKSNSRFGEAGDYCIAAQGRLQLLGFFQDTGPQAWRTEGALEMSRAREQKIAVATKNFVVITHGQNFQQEEILQLAAQEETRLAALLQCLQLPEARAARVLPLQVHLWDSFEKKALFTRNADLRHCDRAQREAHLVWTPTVRGDDFFAESQSIVSQLLPASASPALAEGLAVALSDGWRGSGFAGWTTRMISTGNAIAIEELFDPEVWRVESPLTRQPLLGSLMKFLLEHYTAAEFAALLQAWPERGLPAQFPRGESWQEIRNLCYQQVIKTPPLKLHQMRPPAFSALNFQRGFCYAHEGYQVYNGYMGHRSRAALQSLAAIGGNAISVTPFGYLENAQRPSLVQRSEGLGGENDESLLAALQYGHELGMKVMLKPHLWVGGSSSGWPGEIQMNETVAWGKFFDYYERWMRHYAMLAEMYGFDSLCLGVELVQATRGHESEWRAMISRLRGLYSGPLLYAANWGEEFERLALWNDLDAIALNCYYPLSEKENAGDGELLAGAQAVAQKVEAVARKFGKPVVITEIGFCSRPAAWVHPHRDERRAPAEQECQRRSYAAIHQAFAGRDWLAGIYWWKWPSDLSDGGSEDNQFTPNGKAAAQVVARWYKSEAGSATTSQ